jgi:Ca-activated chloride channel family protein
MAARTPASLASYVSIALAALFCIGAASLFISAEARTPEAPPRSEQALREAGLVRLSEIEEGALLLKAQEPGWYLEAPRVATDVATTVSGPVIRTTVTQRFTNPSEQWAEGVYVFPLPEDAGVDALRLVIGERVIEGEIQERQAARRIYEQAREEGRRASLVEQERPNVFTTSVANIGPGETVAVQIEYQASARVSDGVFELRMPMVVAPRYNPAPDPLRMVSTRADADPVPDRDRISPPYVDPHAEPGETTRLPVRQTIRLDAGFPLGDVTSEAHPILVTRTGETRAHVTLVDGEVPANRDFVLRWSPRDAETPQAALFSETVGGDTYLLAMISPPSADIEAARRPREAVFVIDVSGSMAGGSIEQARQALDLALSRLRPQDRFNVIAFNHEYRALHPRAVDATRDAVKAAREWTARLDADGGTEMLPALSMALVDPDRRAEDGRVRQVIFLTDGAIGNEDQLFRAIDAGLGRSRLFTVGIGSAPNSYFMSRAARIGRGTFTHVSDVAETEDAVAGLFQALERPVMTDVDALFEAGALAEVWPAPLPDLYSGEPVVFTARLEDASGAITVEGRRGGALWRETLGLSEARPAEGVAKLWARDRIAAIEETRFQGADPQSIDAQVLETALGFDLVTRLTSLVAVDRTPARPDGEDLETRDVPLMLPDGWDFEAVFGDAAAAPAPPAPMQQASFAMLARSAPPAPAAQAADASGLALPATASLRDLLVLAGFLLMIAAGVFLMLTDPDFGHLRLTGRRRTAR